MHVVFSIAFMSMIIMDVQGEESGLANEVRQIVSRVNHGAVSSAEAWIIRSLYNSWDVGVCLELDISSLLTE